MEGLIIKSLSGVYDCYVSGKIYKCKPLGVFRHKGIVPKVGDICEIEDNTIIKIKNRKNDFIRPYIANIDKAFIVTSVIEPDLNLNLLDRLIANNEYNNIQSVLLFTKLDLVNKDDYKNIFEYYKKIGYKVFLLPFEKDEVIKELDNNVCALEGQSGVGKSTFINLISDLNLKTNAISMALGRGKHTTRYTELIRINNGWLADTPGFGILELEMDDLSLSQSFVEFFKEKCRFSKCLHLNEPGCAVKEKVNNGEILKSRYDNYKAFNEELHKKEKEKKK